jgi:hypothetical protein
MADEQESQGFTVRDRRAFSPEGDTKPPEERRAEPVGEGQDPTRKAEETPRDVPLPEPDFSSFLTFFFFQQALMFLGQIPHPETQKPEPNLPMARYLIDTLAMIKEKTKGNLTPEEQKHLDGFLADLRMVYVKAVRT